MRQVLVPARGVADDVSAFGLVTLGGEDYDEAIRLLHG